MQRLFFTPLFVCFALSIVDGTKSAFSKPLSPYKKRLQTYRTQRALDKDPVPSVTIEERDNCIFSSIQKDLYRMQGNSRSNEKGTLLSNKNQTGSTEKKSKKRKRPSRQELVHNPGSHSSIQEPQSREAPDSLSQTTDLDEEVLYSGMCWFLGRMPPQEITDDFKWAILATYFGLCGVLDKKLHADIKRKPLKDSLERLYILYNIPTDDSVPVKQSKLLLAAFNQSKHNNTGPALSKVPDCPRRSLAGERKTSVVQDQKASHLGAVGGKIYNFYKKLSSIIGLEIDHAESLGKIAILKKCLKLVKGCKNPQINEQSDEECDERVPYVLVRKLYTACGIRSLSERPNSKTQMEGILKAMRKIVDMRKEDEKRSTPAFPSKNMWMFSRARVCAM